MENNSHWLTVLNREIIACTRCPRLVAYREQIAREKRRAYRDQEYWGKPVPGFAEPNAIARNDGLTLKDLYITAAVRCAPPANKPTPQELANCSHFLDREMAGLEKVKVVVALGKIGFDAYLNYLQRRGQLASKKAYVFKHGASYRLPDGKVLLASYHPSNQNTQTGKLTRTMFVKIFKDAARLADE